MGKIDATIKTFSSKGKAINAKVLVDNREVTINPETTPLELNKAAQQIKTVSELLPGKRFALVIGNSTYDDEHLATLKSAVVDAERFADALSDQNIGAFTHVQVLIDKTYDVIKRAIELFFKDKLKEDMALIYFSGHGIKSLNGQLSLAAQNTDSNILRSTGVSANFIKENMRESGSQRQILILDCCYGGAIVEGAKSNYAIGQPINSVLSFQSSGFGKIIITASEAMQYAFDGKKVEGHIQNSVFTQHLIDGLKTGKADTDNDGLIDIDELYQYAYKHVTPQQTPNISSTAQEGRMYIGLNPNPTVQLAELPKQLQHAISSENRVNRRGAVSELSQLIKSPDPSILMAAETALRKMVNDDSRSVGDFAQEVLNQNVITQAIHTQETLNQKQVPLLKSHTKKSPTADTLTHKNTELESQPENDISPVKSKRNENAGGCLNVIIPGLSHAIVGNWGRAVITFILTSVTFVILGGMLFSNSGVYAGLLALGVLVYLFFGGRKLFRKDNE